MFELDYLVSCLTLDGDVLFQTQRWLVPFSSWTHERLMMGLWVATVHLLRRDASHEFGDEECLALSVCGRTTSVVTFWRPQLLSTTCVRRDWLRRMRSSVVPRVRDGRAQCLRSWACPNVLRRSPRELDGFRSRHHEPAGSSWLLPQTAVDSLSPCHDASGSEVCDGCATDPAHPDDSIQNSTQPAPTNVQSLRCLCLFLTLSLQTPDSRSRSFLDDRRLSPPRHTLK